MDSHMMLPTNPIFSPEFMMENARQYLFLAANYKNQLFNHFFKSFLSYQDLVENDSNKESNSLQKPNLNKIWKGISLIVRVISAQIANKPLKQKMLKFFCSFTWSQFYVDWSFKSNSVTAYTNR